MKGRINDIKRFAVHDGPGIRTTVFLKGCPLKCVWCHNPEGIGFEPQLAYYTHKCLNCGRCVSLCPSKAHQGVEEHLFDREHCIACGKCADHCLNGALKLYGVEWSVEELLPLLLEDRIFYETSGGGVTISGGECLAQPSFCLVLLKALKQEGIHTAVDTCGFVAPEILEQVIPYVDLFLYDLKAMDEECHIRCTGKSNRLILENLRKLDEAGCNIEIRVPCVPGWNMEQIEKIKRFAETLKNVQKITLLEYHNHAAGKYAALGMENTLPPLNQ